MKQENFISERQSNITLLISEYNQLREDERVSSTQQLTVLSIACASTLAAMVLLINNESEKVDSNLIFWATILAPAVLLLPIGMSAIIGAEATLRSYYIRAIERKIQDEIAGPSPSHLEIDSEVSSYTRLRPYSFSELSVQARGTSRENSGGLPLLMLAAGFFSSSLLVLVWKAFRMLAEVNAYAAVFVILLYVVIAIQIGRKVVSTSVGGKAYFAHVVGRANVRRFRSIMYDSSLETRVLSELNAGASKKRESDSIAVLPKKDDVLKIVIEILGSGVAAYLAIKSGVSPLSSSNLLILVTGILYFELFLYQSRYLINDFLGRQEEVKLQSRSVRNRLRTDPHEILVAVRSLLVRAGVFLTTLFVIVISNKGLSILFGAAILIIITAIYEALRKMESRVRPLSKVQKLYAFLLYLAVGFGMPLRFFVGFLLYFELSDIHNDVNAVNFLTESIPRYVLINPGLLSCFIIWCFTYSISSVAPTWVIEGLAEVKAYGPGALSFEWQAEGKRHVWLTMKAFLRVLRIESVDVESETSKFCRISELSAQACWHSVAVNRCRFYRRIWRWFYTPWVIFSLFSFAVSLYLAGLLFEQWLSVPLFMVALVIVSVGYVIAVDLSVTSSSELIVKLFTFVPPLISGVIVAMGSSTVFENVWYRWLIVSFLLVMSGPLWFGQVRGTYSESRHLVSKAIQSLLTIDRRIAQRIVSESSIILVQEDRDV